MSKKQLRTKLIKLLRTEAGVESEIAKLQNQLVRQLCPKRKKGCEPAYCTLRVTETCPFLEEWREILVEAKASDN